LFNFVLAFVDFTTIYSNFVTSNKAQSKYPWMVVFSFNSLSALYELLKKCPLKFEHEVSSLVMYSSMLLFILPIIFHCNIKHKTQDRKVHNFEEA
jgi:hypothetical protein